MSRYLCPSQAGIVLKPLNGSSSILAQWFARLVLHFLCDFSPGLRKISPRPVDCCKCCQQSTDSGCQFITLYTALWARSRTSRGFVCCSCDLFRTSVRYRLSFLPSSFSAQKPPTKQSTVQERRFCCRLILNSGSLSGNTVTQYAPRSPVRHELIYCECRRNLLVFSNLVRSCRVLVAMDLIGIYKIDRQ